LSDAAAASAPAWNASHREKEEKLLKRERDDKLDAALGYDSLLPHERQSVAEITTHRDKRRKLDAENDRTRRAKQAALSRPRPFELRGLPINCSSDLPVDVHRECLAYIAEKRGVMVSAENLDQAALFVVNNPGRPKTEQCLVAALLGGAIACPLYLLSGGESGTRVWYNAATRVRRRVFISIAFVRVHPEVAGLVAAVLDTPSSKWKSQDTLAQYKAYMAKDATRPPKSRKPMDFIALLTKEEARVEGLEGVKNVFEKDAFCKWVMSTDTASSSCGTAML
jgi:hypothetical protein